MNFVSLQGVNPVLQLRAEEPSYAGPSPQPATAGPATAKRGFTISITAFCMVGQIKTTKQSALFIFQLFPNGPRRISEFMRLNGVSYRYNRIFTIT